MVLMTSGIPVLAPNYNVSHTCLLSVFGTDGDTPWFGSKHMITAIVTSFIKDVVLVYSV